MSNGHDDDFRAFVHGSSQRLLRVAYALTGDHGVAEDLLQDVLVRLYARWRRVDEPMAYCRRAMVNGSINRWRGR